jgi:hypothetical protein
MLKTTSILTPRRLCRTWYGLGHVEVGVSHPPLPLSSQPAHHLPDKQGTNGKVTGLWPGSSLHYIQVLAEDRWEDYEWTHESGRYSYWGHGLSWIEEPDLDPLGATKQDMVEAMTTLPKKDSDLSFYLWESSPLPESSFADGLSEERVQDGGHLAWKEALHATTTSDVDKHATVACITVPV